MNTLVQNCSGILLSSVERWTDHDTTSSTAQTKSMNGSSQTRRNTDVVRTVSDESWHGEFRRVEALELGAAGLFKIAGVEDHAQV